MLTLRFNDASEIKITDAGVVTGVTKSNDILTDYIRFTPVDMELQEIHTTFKDTSKTETLHVIDDTTMVEQSTFYGYTGLNAINVTVGDEIAYTIEMIRPTDITALSNSINSALNDMSALKKDTTEKLETFDGKVDTVTSTVSSMNSTLTNVNNKLFPDPSTMALEQLKAYRVNESKLNLAAWFADHPLESTAHKGESGLYSVTAEKQSLLQAAIMVAQIQASNGNEEYKISWNQTGAECTDDWTIEELTNLAIEISDYVRPYVTAQQTKETQIMAAETEEDVNAVDLTYDSVVVE